MLARLGYPAVHEPIWLRRRGATGWPTGRVAEAREAREAAVEMLAVLRVMGPRARREAHNRHSSHSAVTRLARVGGARVLAGPEIREAH